MSFLSPLFLVGLAAIAGPLLLHLFARENAPVSILPTARFIPRAEVRQTSRRRVHDLWLLALRMLAVALLALVFARPFLPGVAAEAPRSLTILAVDQSFSAGGADRERDLRRVARSELDRVPAGDLVALVTFDSEARVAVAPTSDRREIDATIGRLAAGHGSTNYAAAMRSAFDLAGGRPARLVIVTDGQRAGVDREGLPRVPGTLDVVMVQAAAAAENLSVDAIERDAQGLAALLRNHGLADRRVQVRWLVDGTEVAAPLVDVAAGAAVDVRLDRRVPEGVVVTAAIEDPSGYPADNRRFLVTDPPRRLPVVVINSIDGPREASLYVQAALEAAGTEVDGFATTVVNAGDARLSQGGLLREARVIVVVGTRGLDRAGRLAVAGAVRGGTGLLLAAGPEVEPGVVAELLGRDEFADASDVDAGGATLAATDARHPVLAQLGYSAGNLGQVTVQRAWALRDVPGALALLRLSSGAAVLSEVPLDQGRAFVLTTDLGRRWNSWPVHPTFVPLLVGSVEYLSGERPRARDATVAGIAGELARPGVTTMGADQGRVAVNVDPRESRVDTVSPAEFAGLVVSDAAAPGAGRSEGEDEAGQALWRYVLWILLGTLALEALIAARRRPLERAAERDRRSTVTQSEGA